MKKEMYLIKTKGLDFPDCLATQGARGTFQRDSNTGELKFLPSAVFCFLDKGEASDFIKKAETKQDEEMVLISVTVNLDNELVE